MENIRGVGEKERSWGGGKIYPVNKCVDIYVENALKLTYKHL